jgi:Sec-independent protein translocase protein TatA
LAIKGSEWVLVALLAGSMVSDPDKLPSTMRTVARAKEQFDQLSAQAKDALDRAVRNIEETSGKPMPQGAAKPEPVRSGGLSLIDLARRLGVPTEGRTADEIADSIAQMAVKAAQKTQ